MRTLWAGGLYFAAAFAIGFALAPVRVLVLAPRIGEAWATAAESAVLLAALWFAARWIVRRFALNSAGARLAMGAIGLLLLLAAEIALGAAWRGLDVAAFLARFAAPAGMVYGAALVAFALMPLAASR
ncbi:MAG: hypothetical protein GC206_09975 [Alphaproteobacteria bacterium]|nr:hypothetical protein [Alphaproteobacteria bacterium]